MVRDLVVVTIAGFGLLVHFGFTALWLGPDNLLKQKALPWLQPYFFGIFAQNWHLFSPNPGFSSFVWLIGCASHDGDTVWIKPVEPIKERHYGNRFTASGKMLYVYDSLARTVLEVAHREEGPCQGKPNKCAFSLTDKDRLSALHGVEQFGSSSCASRNPTWQAKEIKLFVVMPQPFSKRHESQSHQVTKEVSLHVDHI